MEGNNEKKYDLETLVKIFKAAGASNPVSWANSEINEGINQLARFSFLKAITSEVLKDNDLEWYKQRIDFTNGEQKQDLPCSQLSAAIKEMLDKRVSNESINDLIRVIQFETLEHVCSTIDRAYEPDTPIKNWALVEIDDNGQPIREISSIHESLLQFDPSGKEFRPREINKSY